MRHCILLDIMCSFSMKYLIQSLFHSIAVLYLVRRKITKIHDIPNESSNKQIAQTSRHTTIIIIRVVWLINAFWYTLYLIPYLYLILSVIVHILFFTFFFPSCENMWNVLELDYLYTVTGQLSVRCEVKQNRACEVKQRGSEEYFIMFTIHLAIWWDMNKRELLISFLNFSFFHISAIQKTISHSYLCDKSEAKWLNGIYFQQR